MSMRINTNLSAMKALRNLNAVSEELQKPVNRLSTGLRINSAADDPAGLVISEGLRSQTLAIDQAMRNSQDAINMSKTAEGALQEVQNLLKGIRALAVHSANAGVVDSNVLNANQSQIRSTIASINRIASHTQFGNKRLLDGTAGVLASVTAPQFVSGAYMGGTFNSHPIESGPITVQLTTQAERAAVSTLQSYASAASILPAGSITVNGMTFITTGTDTLQDLVGRINASSATSGVTAQIVGSGPVTVDLVQVNYGADFAVQLFDNGNILHTSPMASDSGVDAVADVTVTTAEGVETVQFLGGRGSRESGLRLTDTFGNAINLTENGNLNMAGATQIGVVTAGAVQIQFGPNTNQATQLSIPAMFASSLGTSAVPGESVESIDVTTTNGAQNAMKIIDDAITQLARARGEIGSFQKDFLESNVRSLGVARENLTATESQIRDADIAEEITQYTKLQILQQSGMAVLAQANQLPQSVLRLLNG
jgi:flagellin